MIAWATGPFLGFDTETTGVRVTSDRIVTAALVSRDSTGTRERTWLIDPGVEIPAAATAIHGISTEKARMEGADPRVALPEIADTIAVSVRQGVPIVAFNAGFDLEILDRELHRHGLPDLAERAGTEVRPVIDPLVLDRAVDRYRRGKRTLGDLMDVYAVSEAPDAELHTAEVDVVATLDVLVAIATRHERKLPADLDALHDFQVESHRAWAENFNQWLESKGRTPDVGTAWPY